MDLREASQNTPSIDISIIVPTYNERDNIQPLVERVHKALSDFRYEIIIVDDNSPDGTADIAESLSTEYPLRVIVRKTERGLATAVIAGFNEARGEVIGVIDADLQHPPEHIPALLQATKDGADVAIASRYVPGGGIEGWTLKRAIGSKVAKLPATMLFPSIRHVKDPLSGFFVFRKKVIDGVVLAPIGYKILLEVLLRGEVNSVAEVPYTFRERERGQSNFNFTEEVNYAKHLTRLAWAEDEIKRFIKFCLVGGSGVFVNFGFFWILTRFAGLGANSGGHLDLIALAISIELSILTNFTLNELWTFRDRRIGNGSFILLRALKFNLVCGGGFLIQQAIYFLLTRPLGLSEAPFDLLALLIAIVIATSWNFTLSTHWTWAAKTLRRV